MSQSIVQHKVASSYAGALSDVIVDDQEFLSAIRQLYRFSDVMSQRRVKSLWSSPRVADQKKLDFLQDVWKHSLQEHDVSQRQLLYGFVVVLFRAKRLDVLSAVVDISYQLLQKRRGVYQGVLILAHQRDQGFIEEIRELSERAFAMKLELELRYDSSLLSGFLVRVGYWCFDQSLRSRLENMKQALEGSS